VEATSPQFANVLSSMKALVRSVAVLLAGVCAAGAAESDALTIAARIRALHTPFGSLLDPIYASSASDQIVGYTRCGDSALWTGAYLAAESFHYNVTRSPEALQDVRAALASLQALSAITGDNRLARCMVLTTSPFANGIAQEEAQNQIIYNQPWFWVDNTSRDQIVGAFFGLGVAYDLVDQPDVKQGVSDLATLLIGYISRHKWSPNDDLTSTFQVRPEGLQMLLQVARHVNPANGVSGPFLVPPVDTGVEFDVQSNSSYFKFDLDYMSLYHLVRLQDNNDNRGAYDDLRAYTASHQNAFFNLIDRALRGPDPVRDAETRSLLDQMLTRPSRDFFVDLSPTVAVCGSEACLPIPVPLRAPATFLWEVSPFQLKGGGNGQIESSGLDYMLPYWMARYYGVIENNAVTSAASQSVGVAAGSLATVYGQGLAGSTAQALSLPLPAALGGATIELTDSSGVRRAAPLLYASPTQINFEIPENAAAGAGSIGVTAGGVTQTFPVSLRPVAPALFSMNARGTGVAAALAVAVQAANPELQSAVPVFRCGTGGCVSVPLSLGVDRPLYVSFYGTGMRTRSAVSHVTVTIGGVDAPVQSAGPAPGFVGLDQVNVLLPITLRGRGESDVVLTVDGETSNTVTINIQ
jgi:uncharacterized protein (TIGR03437 family)